MTKQIAGTLRLALAIAVVDILLLFMVLAVAPVLYGTTDWLSEWLVISALYLGYRLASLQPLYLYLVLKLFRQRLDRFSQVLVMLLSTVSTLMSLLVIGFLFALLAGGGVSASVAYAFEFFKSFMSGLPESMLNAALFAVLLLSPIIVFHGRRLLGGDVK